MMVLMVMFMFMMMLMMMLMFATMLMFVMMCHNIVFSFIILFTLQRYSNFFATRLQSFPRKRWLF